MPRHTKSVLLAMALLCHFGTAHGEDAKRAPASVPLNANYVPANASEKPAGCPNYVPLKSTSLQSMDFLKRMYRKAQITSENTGDPTTFRYAVLSQDMAPNTLIITVSLAKPELLTWNEEMRDKNNKPMNVQEGLCKGGHYVAKLSTK